MLLAEEQQYIEEMEAKEETTLERQAKMRERAKFLKEKREQERLKLVQEKLDQRWRYVAALDRLNDEINGSIGYTVYCICDAIN